MRVRGHELTGPELLLVGLAGVTVLVLVIAASTSTAAFGTYNPYWDGTADLRADADDRGVETVVALETETYDRLEANGTLAIVLSPSEPYADRDQERLRTFVRAGGTLLVAEAYGPHGNDLLAAVGATARVDGTPVRDEHEYDRSPALPRATNVSDHRFVNGTDALTLNHGSVVIPNDASVLIRSSPYAYLDLNRNEQLDEHETLASHPVVTVEQLGDGHVVVVSDPSVFINVMLERPGNLAFAHQLLDEHDRLLIDYSHAETIPPLQIALLTIRGSAVLQLLVGVGVLLAIGIVARHPPVVAHISNRLRRSRPEPTTAQPTAEMVRTVVTRQYPDWEPERRERVIRGIISARQLSEDDE